MRTQRRRRRLRGKMTLIEMKETSVQGFCTVNVHMDGVGEDAPTAIQNYVECSTTPRECCVRMLNAEPRGTIPRYATQ